MFGLQHPNSFFLPPIHTHILGLAGEERSRCMVYGAFEDTWSNFPPDARTRNSVSLTNDQLASI